MGGRFLFRLTVVDLNTLDIHYIFFGFLDFDLSIGEEKLGGFALGFDLQLDSRWSFLGSFVLASTLFNRRACAVFDFLSDLHNERFVFWAPFNYK